MQAQKKVRSFLSRTFFSIIYKKTQVLITSKSRKDILFFGLQKRVSPCEHQDNHSPKNLFSRDELNAAAAADSRLIYLYLLS